MDCREAMAFSGVHPPSYFPRGAFTSIYAPQSASDLHAPPDLIPMPNLNLLQHHHPSDSANHPFPFDEQIHQDFSDFSYGIHMGVASSQTVQTPSPPPPVAATEPVVNKKRGRPRKFVSDNQSDHGLSPMTSTHKPKTPSSVSNPNAPKRARGRPPGTGRKQRLANLGEWMNSSAGLAFAPHVINVEAGEDIVAKVLSFSQQRPRALCIMSGTGTVSSVTLRKPASSVPSLSFQGHYNILSLRGSYLVNDEAGPPKSRSGGISVALSCPDGYLLGGGVATLIAASLVQVVAYSFVYRSANSKAMKQENGSNMETTTSESPPPPAIESVGEEEAAQTPPDFSGPAMTTGWSGAGGGSRPID